MTIDYPTAAEGPTIEDLRVTSTTLLADLRSLLADARQWAGDVARTVDEDDPRGRTAEQFATEVAEAADVAAEGVHWFDNLRATGVHEKQTRGWNDQAPTPSETVNPSDAPALFNPAVHNDGQPWTWAEVEHARESDIAARAAELHARADLLRVKTTRLAEQAYDWTEQDRSAAADQYADYDWFGNTDYAVGEALSHVRTFEQDGLQATQPPEESGRSTAALFAASTNELLGFAEDVQHRTHEWVDAVVRIECDDESSHYRQAADTTMGVDQTVASLRHAARDFALFDNPDLDDAPATSEADDFPTETSVVFADELPDRDELAEVTGTVAADLDELAGALTRLRDEATDWSRNGAVAEAGDDVRRLSHVHNARSELDDAVQAAQHGSWQVGEVAYNRYSTESAAEAAEQQPEPPTQQALADLVAGLGDVEDRLHAGLDEHAAARVASDLHRAQHSLAWAAQEIAEADAASAQALLPGPDAMRQRIQGRVMGPNGQISDQEFVLRATEAPVAGGDGGAPFELTELHPRLDESLAAAENGLSEIRAAQAAEHQHEADIARWHADDRAAEQQRTRDSGRAVEADSEPPF